jgi:hypothetical protein
MPRRACCATWRFALFAQREDVRRRRLGSGLDDRRCAFGVAENRRQADADGVHEEFGGAIGLAVVDDDGHE